jgi:GT2 family glycosyltransferase
MSPTITIGFSARERFLMAGESLASLYEHTMLPFELLVVDAATPERYLREMHEVLDRHDNWRMLRSDHYLLPAAAKNLILREVRSDYVCLLENDTLFTDGWLEALVDACETFPADVAAPAIREGHGEEEHFDAHLGTLVQTEDGLWDIKPLKRARNAVPERERVQFVEQHCLLFRRSVFDRIGRYDEELNTRDEVDLSLALHHAGATVVLEPRSIVNYVPPSSAPEEDELPYYRMRWDLDRAAASRERIKQRWSLVDTPGDLGFVQYRNLIPELPVVRSKLEKLIESGHRVVLIDNGDWFDTEVTEGLALTPFPDSGGHFGGFPESDDAASRELDAAFEAGATAIVVGWPAQWWFDHLAGLRPALSEWATLVGTDGLVEIFSRSPVPRS